MADAVEDLTNCPVCFEDYDQNGSHVPRIHTVVYLLAKLKPSEQKEHFSLKEQNGLVWNLAYVRNGTDLPGGSNPQPPGWKLNALTHWPTNPTNGQRNNTVNFRCRGQGRGNFRGNMRGKGRGRGRFDKSLNVRRPRVASKTVDKDKMRCHYCNEYGHFIRECSKKNRDENKTGHFNGMSMDYYENDLYTGEDYDDDVFASLNS